MEGVKDRVKVLKVDGGIMQNNSIITRQVRSGDLPSYISWSLWPIRTSYRGQPGFLQVGLSVPFVLHNGGTFTYST